MPDLENNLIVRIQEEAVFDARLSSTERVVREVSMTSPRPFAWIPGAGLNFGYAEGGYRAANGTYTRVLAGSLLLAANGIQYVGLNITTLVVGLANTPTAGVFPLYRVTTTAGVLGDVIDERLMPGAFTQTVTDQRQYTTENNTYTIKAADLIYSTFASMQAAVGVADKKIGFVLATEEYFEFTGGVWVSRGMLGSGALTPLAVSIALADTSTGSIGVSARAAREDHRHPLPTLAQLGLGNVTNDAQLRRDELGVAVESRVDADLARTRLDSSEKQNPIGRAPDFTYATLALMNAATVSNGVFAFVVETKEYFQRVTGVWNVRGRFGSEETVDLIDVHNNDIDAHNLAVLGDSIAANTANIIKITARLQRSFTRVGFDDFNRTSGAMGSAVFGGVWSGFGVGLAVISGNAAVSAAPGTPASNYGGLLLTRANEQRITATVNTVSGTVGLLIRYQDSSNYAMVIKDAANVIIYDVIANVQTTRAVYPLVPTAADIFRVEIVSNTITVVVNSVVLGSYVTALTTTAGLSAGFRLSGAGSVDDIEVANETGVVAFNIRQDATLYQNLSYTLIAADTFTRADGALAGSTTTTGTFTWSALFSVGASISGNKVAVAAGSGINLLSATFADAAISADIVLSTSVACDAWIYFRFNSTTNTGVLIQRTNTGTVSVQKQVNGATTPIGGATVPNVPNGTVERMTVLGIGSSITVLLNGVVVLTLTETTSQTIATHGLRLSGTAASIDNFRVLQQGAIL